MRFVGLSLLVALALAALGSSAASAARVRTFFGPGGSESFIRDLNNRGLGGGQEFFQSGMSQQLWFDGKRFWPFGQGAFLGVDEAGDAAGLTEVGNQILAAYVFGIHVAHGRLIGQPHIIQLQGGEATGISHERRGVAHVVGQFLGSDFLLHAFIFNPVNRDFVDLGPGRVSGVGADGDFLVGRDNAGHPIWWDRHGRHSVVALIGNLLRVDLLRQAAGYELLNGGPEPIVDDLAHGGRVTRLPLPRGEMFGSALSIADNGKIVGNVGPNPRLMPTEGVEWTHLRNGHWKVMPVTKVFAHQWPHGAQVIDAATINDNGQVAGEVQVGNQAGAFVASPDPIAKIDNLIQAFAYLGNQAVTDKPRLHQIPRLLEIAQSDLRSHDKHSACHSIELVQRTFSAKTKNPDATELLDSLAELKGEIPCH